MYCVSSYVFMYNEESSKKWEFGLSIMRFGVLHHVSVISQPLLA